MTTADHRRAVDRIAVDPADVPGFVLDPATVTDALIAAYDLAGTDPALRARVQRALAAAGVQPIAAPEGDPVDGARHRTVTVTGAPGDGEAGRIARQVRAGWHRGDAVVRAADVAVWG